MTYRYSGHNVGEKGLYRTQEEISDWKTNRDPIDQFIIRLTENQLLSQSELEDLRSSVKQEILAAVEYAESSPDPDISTLMVGVDSGRLGMVRK